MKMTEDRVEGGGGRVCVCVAGGEGECVCVAGGEGECVCSGRGRERNGAVV